VDEAEVHVMKTSRRVLEALFSGVVVYGLMAACSGSISTTPGRGGAGGTAHGGSGGKDSGIFDALTDPVPTAEAGPENPQSGTRLKGKFTMGADGSKEYQLALSEMPVPGVGLIPGSAVHAVWYDTALAADCSFYPAADGATRCLPGHMVQVFFADDQCTQPVVAMTGDTLGCPTHAPPKYGLYAPLTTETAMCSPPYVNPQPLQVVQIGGSTAAPAKAYTTGGNGAGAIVCIATSISFPVTWYQASEVPPTAFVQGTAGVDP
jgi:hypothetical protein